MGDSQESPDQLLQQISLLEASLAQHKDGARELEHVLDTAPILVCVAGLDGYYKRVNSAFEKILGHTEQESLSRPFIEFIHPDDRPAAVATLERLAAGEVVFNFEDRNICKEGSYRWLSWTIIPLPDKGIVYGVGHDITDRKRYENELGRQRTRAQTYLDIAGVILVVLDKNGDIELLNQKGHEILGYDEGNLVGRNWFAECVPARERVRVLAAFSAVVTGNVEPVEYYENLIITRSGEERLIAWHNTLLTDENGRRIGTLSSGTDITDQRVSEEALQEAHDELEERVKVRTAQFEAANNRLRSESEGRKQADEQLAAVYDGMPDGLLVVDIATKRLLRANQSISQMLGYSEAELASMHVKDIHPEDDLPDILETFVALAEGRTSLAENVRMLRKDGSVFYADITTNNITYDSRPCQIGFFRDVTERKKDQDELRREHHVLRDLLRSQDRDRKLIAYEIHDGLAQQLAGAQMHFETCRQSEDRNSEISKQNCDTGIHLLGSSLTEARHLISGLRPPILDESGVVAAIRHLVQDMSAPNGPEIEFHSRVTFDRLEPVLENSVYRIVQECLTNACRHSQSKQVQIDLSQHDGGLRIEITDWGIGFDPVAVGEDCYGLEGVQERARILGGQASITSSVGKGTQVSVDLPLILSQ